MGADTVQTYAGLYLHAARLTGRALKAKWPWLFIAPAAALVFMVSAQLVSRFVPGIAGGFLLAFVRAAILSLVLYVARAIIEQRRLDTDDLASGLGAFLGDVMTVFFALWIAGFLLGTLLPPLMEVLSLLVLLMPTFETVALSPVAGFSMFSSAWSFLRREAGPWLMGHLPLLLLLPVHLGLRLAVGFVPFGMLPSALRMPLTDLLEALPWTLWFVAFLYRGILFLTLDSTSRRARAERWGGRER